MFKLLRCWWMLVPIWVSPPPCRVRPPTPISRDLALAHPERRAEVEPTRRGGEPSQGGNPEGRPVSKRSISYPGSARIGDDNARSLPLTVHPPTGVKRILDEWSATRK